MALTQQEKMFLNRVATKMVAGMDIAAAGRAVLAEDKETVAKYHRLDQYDRRHVARGISHRVFADIHTRLAGA